MSNNKALYLSVTIALTISACGTTQPFFYKSGEAAHIISCSNNSWTKCMERASEICLDSGYEILEKNTTRTSGFFGYSDNREMIIKCNKPIQSNAKNIPKEAEKPNANENLTDKSNQSDSPNSSNSNAEPIESKELKNDQTPTDPSKEQPTQESEPNSPNESTAKEKDNSPEK